MVVDDVVVVVAVCACTTIGAAPMVTAAHAARIAIECIRMGNLQQLNQWNELPSNDAVQQKVAD